MKPNVFKPECLISCHPPSIFLPPASLPRFMVTPFIWFYWHHEHPHHLSVVCEQPLLAPPSVWSVSKHRQLHLQCGLWANTVSSTFSVVCEQTPSAPPSVWFVNSHHQLYLQGCLESTHFSRAFHRCHSVQGATVFLGPLPRPPHGSLCFHFCLFSVLHPGIRVIQIRDELAHVPPCFSLSSESQPT